MRKRMRCLWLLVAILSTGMLHSSAQPVEIRLAGWSEASSSGQLLLQLIDEFNSMQDRIHVLHEVYGGEEALLVAYTGGVAPDIAITSGPSPMVYGGDDGFLLPLDRFIDGENGFPRDVFIDDMWSFTVVGGKTYGIAVDSNERALFVNKAYAENAGLSTNDPPRDWADLLDWAQKMTVRQGDDTFQWGFYTQFGRGGDLWHTIYLNDGEIFSADGQALIVDHPNTVEAVQFLADMVLEHQVAPPIGGFARDDFAAGHGAMLIGHSGLMGTFDNDPLLEYMTVPGPPGTGKHGGRFSGASTSTFIVPDSTRHPDAVWEFIRWITLEHGNTFARERNLLPLLRSGLQESRYMSQPWDAFAHSILTYNPRTYVHARVASRDWWAGSGNLGAAIADIVTGVRPAESTLQHVAATVNARLRQIREGGM